MRSPLLQPAGRERRLHAFREAVEGTGKHRIAADLAQAHAYWFRGGFPEPWLAKDDGFHGRWTEYSCYRTGAGAEVDLVLDGDFGRLAVEVKHTSFVAPRDLRGLRDFVTEPHRKALGGLVRAWQTACPACCQRDPAPRRSPGWGSVQARRIVSSGNSTGLRPQS
jgi:hypothetical protein